MASTVEENLKIIIGGIVMQLAAAQTKARELAEENEKLKAQLEKERE